MKMLSLKPLGLLLAFTFCVMSVIAQNPKKARSISAVDQKAVKALFVGVVF